ncbi:MAG: MMPL family transporter [Niastella sp.]|nr:MMPL family transporter [Niastella sp.]
MWQRLAKLVIKHRLLLIIILSIITGMMGYFASQVKLSYEFAKAIPSGNQKYKDYQAFRQKFGDDGNILVVGIQSDKIFELKNFEAYSQLQQRLKKAPDVWDVMSMPSAVNLVKNLETEKLDAQKIFSSPIQTQPQLDSERIVFENLPFYRSLLYNPGTHAYLMAVRINKDSLNSPKRTQIVNDITNATANFQKETGIQTYVSGLPLIRTVVSDRIQKEMRFFLIASLLLSALILIIFFRSGSTTILSLLVVIMGVIWTVGLMYLFGFKISLLTALAPPLVVVIGIPNCIYFINKYHTLYLHKKNKENALIGMVSKMGVVTLFCNITAAIGFGVFAFTQSAILKEFGIIAGLSIMMVFVISFILLPAVLSFLPAPGSPQLKYLHSNWITWLLKKIENIVLNYRRVIYGITAILVLFSILGMMRLNSVGYIVDDLPQTDKIFKDLKFFENNFKGVMPLEIVVSTKKPHGITGSRALGIFQKVDSLSQYIAAQPNMNRPLSLAEGLKFAKQAFYEGDSSNYMLPNAFDGAFVGEYLRPQHDNGAKANQLSRMLLSFIDTGRQSTRISVSMADVGTRDLPIILKGIEDKAHTLFDSSYTVDLTGTSITFLEGSKYIINGLKESIFWAFLFIALCMLWLFRSGRILCYSLITNIIPLMVTAGIMGWLGVPLKPSTVLVFSVALGIAVDISIRFLVNYRQELPAYKNDVNTTVRYSIRHTGLSIIYTSMVLIAGFVIFCGSSFGGTFALGWLTSLTLIVATATNLILLPVLLMRKAAKHNQK